jgi:hypothetical protein
VSDSGQLQRLLDIEAIKQLKYRYFRFLDQKRLVDLQALLLPECTASYHDGAYRFDDRDGIMAFLRLSVGNDTLLTLHQGHHPEIEFIADDEALGYWYLQDVVINKEKLTRMEGNGFYEDRYRRVNGEWKFAHTGYRRTYDIRQPLGELIEFYDGFECGAYTIPEA